MRGARLAGWLAPVLSSALVAGPLACTPPDRSPTVALRVRGGPDQARVTVDDEPIGALEGVAAHGVALPPGRHRLTVEADGYFPFDRIVDAEVNGPPLQVDVRLEKIPR